MQISQRPIALPALKAANLAVALSTSESAPAKPVGKAPVVKAQAQGAIKTTAQVLNAAFTGAAVGGLGAMAGWGAWFAMNAGGTALSSNVIGIGLLVGVAIGGMLGWKTGGFWGGAIEETLGKK